VEKVNRNRSYRFKVRATNICGAGIFSPELQVNIVHAPALMLAVGTEYDNCSLMIEWIVPDDGGSAITQFDVQIKDSLGDFVSLENLCQNPRSTSCTVPMQVFQDEPYNLRKDDLIFARIAGQNEKGWGVYSQLNSDGASVLSAPVLMEVPVLVNQSPTQIDISW
jgi:hypothetical protein